MKFFGTLIVVIGFVVVFALFIKERILPGDPVTEQDTVLVADDTLPTDEPKRIPAPLPPSKGETSVVPPDVAVVVPPVSPSTPVTPPVSTTPTPTTPVTPVPAPSTPTQPPTPAPAPTTLTVAFPYTHVVLGTPHGIGWQTTQGDTVTVSLLQFGELIEEIPTCRDVKVARNLLQYCLVGKTALSGYVPDKTGYTLRVQVFDGAGKQLESKQTAPFSFIPSNTVSFTPFEDRTYGWSVRYIDGWHHTRNASRAVFARRAADLASPHTTRDAFLVEYCSLAREACVNRVDAFLADGRMHDGAIGGTRVQQVVSYSGGRYVAENMLLRNGIAFFVSYQAVDGSGVAVSPHTYLSIDHFNLLPGDITSERYAFDETLNEGTMFIEYDVSGITYVRFVTGTQWCFSEYETSTFMDVDPRSFRFNANGCVVKGVRSGDVFKLEEDNCEDFHTEECTFDGDYVKREW